MLSAEFITRIIGLFVFSIIGARFGLDVASSLNLPPDSSALLFSLVGAIFGVAVTPFLTVRPVTSLNKSIRDIQPETLIISVIGGAIGLTIALLMAYPLSLMPEPLNAYFPPALSIVGGYLGLTIARSRAREFVDMFTKNRSGQGVSVQSNRKLLVDTSVLIDGRIVDIAMTGFLGGTLLIPEFVMRELQQVADSADSIRRNRGRRGLEKVKELMQNDVTPVRVIDDDVEGLHEVDDKLIALAIQLEAYLLTNDYPLAKIAEAQSVTVLNINLLANAVRMLYIPGETFALHIIQEGTDDGQGVGYLEDGTMVVVENGRRYMDRTVRVEATKVINREAGRMIFAVVMK
jgi:uncharacterized protein YacL